MTSVRDSLAWLLGFAYNTDIDALGDGAAIDLARALHGFIGSDQPAVAVMTPTADRRALNLAAHGIGAPGGFNASKLKAQLCDVQARLREGLTALQDGNGWKVPEIASTLTLVDGRVVRRMKAPFDPLFLAKSVDAVLAGWSQVRPCARETCGRPFVPSDGRQRYCTPRCAQQARWSKFAPQRTRDYRSEYDARIAKKHGRKLRVSGRISRAKG